MRRILQPALVAAVLLAGAILHGIWTDRWLPTSQAQVAEAGSKVKTFPLEIGPWRGEPAPWAEVENAETIETVVTRRYVNRLNGSAVGVLLGCGHSRNLSMFHTPLECYPSQGYTLTRPSEKHSLRPNESSPVAEFLVSDFKMTKGPLTQNVRVFWAWSGSGKWQVPEQLRLTFGPYRVLYKVYVTRALSDSEEPIATDPCVDFLRDLLPELNRSLFPGR
jgi:hypothetical protein